MLHSKQQSHSMGKKKLLLSNCFSDTSRRAHCSVHREALRQRRRSRAQIEPEIQQNVSLYCNPFDVSYLLTQSVGQTLVICLEHYKIKRPQRDGGFTMIQPVFASPSAHIYFVSIALASFSHESLPILSLAIFFRVLVQAAYYSA